MKTQIITALSIAAVLGTAGGAYAVNQTMLTSASHENSVIGSATPVLVPIAPKGTDIPAEYLERLAAAEAARQNQASASGLGSSSTGVDSPPPSSNMSGSGDESDEPYDDAYDDDVYDDDADDDDDDDDEDDDEDDDDDDDDDGEDEDEDESGDDD